MTTTSDPHRAELRHLHGLTRGADVSVRAGLFMAGQRIIFAFASGRHAYVEVAAGHVFVNGHTLLAGDGATLSEESGEVLVFEPALHDRRYQAIPPDSE